MKVNAALSYKKARWVPCRRSLWGFDCRVMKGPWVISGRSLKLLNTLFAAWTLLVLRITRPLKTIGGDLDGNADFGTGFFDSCDFSPTFHAHGPFRIDLLQDNREIDGLALGERFLRFEKNSRAAEIAGDAFAVFELHGCCITVAGCPFFHGFFH
jgi:hypothetical protein